MSNLVTTTDHWQLEFRDGINLANKTSICNFISMLTAGFHCSNIFLVLVSVEPPALKMSGCRLSSPPGSDTFKEVHTKVAG